MPAGATHLVIHLDAWSPHPYRWVGDGGHPVNLPRTDLFG